MKTCHFCKTEVSAQVGYVDIGGLPLCLYCYESRRIRTHLPCHICRQGTLIESNLLINDTICEECGNKLDLPKAYNAARERKPCDRCSQRGEIQYATCYRQNLCEVCYEAANRPVTQLYCGDRGYSPFPSRKPSLPVVVLAPCQTSEEPRAGCIVCNKRLSDHTGISIVLMLPVLCEECRGPTWWAFMDKNRDELDVESCVVRGKRDEC